MNKFLIFLSKILIISLIITSVNVSAFANTDKDSDVESRSMSLHQPEINITDDGIFIDDLFYSQEEFEDLLNKAIYLDSSEKTRSALVAGTWWIPGVGQVMITITGVVTIAGVTIAAGSWVYNKVKAYFSEKDAKDAASKVPNKLKSGDMQVDLGKFKDKNNKTPLNKSSGTFKNGDWEIVKDTSGHTGYNGNPKAWKLNNTTKKPPRVASLDKYGNIIDK